MLKPSELDAAVDRISGDAAALLFDMRIESHIKLLETRGRRAKRRRRCGCRYYGPNFRKRAKLRESLTWIAGIIGPIVASEEFQSLMNFLIEVRGRSTKRRTA